MCIQSFAGIHQLLGQSSGMYVGSKPPSRGFNLRVMHCSFWPASHSGGEDYSTHGRAFMMRARQARRPPDDVVILDNGASRTYCQYSNGSEILCHAMGQ